MSNFWEGLGSTLGAAAHGLADWIGLGETVKETFQPKKVKQVKTAANKLKDDVAKAIEKGQQRIDDLNNLASFKHGDQKSITARNLIAKSGKKIKDKVSQAKIALETVRSKGDQAIAEAENAKNFKFGGGNKALRAISSARKDFEGALKSDIGIKR